MHVPFEGPGYVEEWLGEKALSLRRWPLYENPVLPDPDDVDFLIVMGGPMNIYESEKYPWLSAEKSFLRACIEQEKKILGICLGAQLLADVLGKACYPGPAKEIGWFPVNLDEKVRKNPVFRHMPPTFIAFHWHGETFDIPEGTLRIAGSEACINQGFIMSDQVLALQFHLEITPGLLNGLIQYGRKDLVSACFVQKESQLLEGLSNRHTNHRLLSGMLDAFLEGFLIDT
jgi:GMP synthase (glutamine-hydrolysing)